MKLFEHLSDGLCLSDGDGRVRYANPAARRLLSVPEPTGRLLCDALCGRMGCKDGCALLEPDGPEAVTLKGRLGPAVAYDWRDVRVLRKETFKDLRVRCMRQPGMRLTLIEDVTDRAELERHKEDWRHMIAHDLRSPVTAIFGTLRSLESAGLQPALLRLVRSSLRSCERMLELLNLYLDVAKLDAGVMPVRLEAVDLRGAAQLACEELQAPAFQRRVTLEVRVPRGLTARGDAALLQRVLRNLLSNAVKFSPFDSAVTVSGQRDGSWAVLSVQDNGPGIEAADVPRVFDRYWQAAKRREGKLQGTGLGLTFCREALKAMGGRIALASEPGSGCVFTAALPAQERS